MNLNNFERYIERRILARGLDYYENNYISSIEEVNEGVYEAKVLGTELYRVEVEVDKMVNIIETQCDCPYDMGEYCKHQVAVFLELRNIVNKTLVNRSSRPSIVKRSKRTDIKKILSNTTKDELIDFLLNLASESKEIKQRIELNFGTGHDKDEIDRCIILIRSYIQRNSDKWGFVHFGDTEEAVKGAEIVLSKARNVLCQNKAMQSLELALCVIHEMMDLLNDSDDSDGIVGGMIQEGFGLIDDIINQEDLSDECKKNVFNRLIQEASNKRYDGWADWRLELLEMSSRLTDNPQLRNEMENNLITMKEMEKGDSWHTNYFAEKINLIRYQMIEKYDGKKKALEFLIRNLHFSDFRVIAIKNAMEEKDYEQVIRLALDGEKLDENLPGLVNQWKEFRYQACKASGKLEGLRDLALDFILNGSMEHYEELKSTYEIRDWVSIYPKIIFMLETAKKIHSNVYTRILITEGEKQKLLEYVKGNPSSIKAFYKEILPEYEDEVKAIFVFYIEQMAARASSRKDYQEVCSIIRTLKKAAGNIATSDVVAKLLVKYPKKPAFRDELTKISIT